METRGCLTEDELFSIASGAVITDSQELVDDHVARCDGCAALIAHLARERIGDRDLADSDDPVALGPGSLVGRYTILALAGFGGMGRVYAAWDPELDRKVALKLLPPARGDVASQERLRREAQAMAKLSHGNVVAVHDVGTWSGGWFLAMEFVDGQTLHSWLRTKPRRWREIVDAFVLAGRGLAAAHAAGLVHRDFKPTNVLMRTDGRVAVTDFGLARALGTAERPGALPASLRETANSIVAGTPAYMAPEQLDGRELDARTDVFSFCVALYEALWSRHPFATESAAALIESVRKGEVRPPPKSPVPARVRKAVLAGLSHDPAARPASMDQLLARLDTRPQRARVAVAAGVAVLATIAVVAVVSRSGAAHDCEGADARLTGVWSAPRRAAILAAFQHSKVPGADQMAAVVLRSFDDYRARWRAGWVDACEATHVHGSQSEALMDARMLCLDDRARVWTAIGDTLARAEPATLDKAVNAVADLPSPEACADPRQLDRDPPPNDPVLRSRRDALRAQLASITADLKLGRTAAAKPRIEAALAEARALGSVPLEAELLIDQGRAEADEAPLSALSTFHLAARTAERAGRDDLVASARVNIVDTLGWSLGRKDEALQWADYAQTTLDRIGDPELAIDLDAMRAETLERAHEPLKALPLGEKVLAYWQAHAKAPDIRLARALSSLAIFHADLYHVELGLDYFRKALAMIEQLYGPDHASTQMFRMNLAAQLRNAARSEEALRLFDQVIEADTRLFGPDGLQLSFMYANSARPLADVGRYAEAEARARRAVDIEVKGAGADTPQLYSAYADLSLYLTAQGRLDEALAAAKRSLEVLQLAPDAKDSRTFFSYAVMGHAYEEMGRCDDALAAFARAQDPLHQGGITAEISWQAVERNACQLEVGHTAQALADVEAAMAEAQTRVAKDNLFFADYLTAVASARLAAGKAAEALEPARQGLAILTTNHVVGLKLVRAQFTLARVMWEALPGERAQAIALAREALAGAQHLVHTKDSIVRWLEKH